MNADNEYLAVATPVEAADPSVCPMCNKQCASPHGVKIHLFRHHGIGKNVRNSEISGATDGSICPECGKQCANRFGLAMHLAKAHGIAGKKRENSGKKRNGKKAKIDYVPIVRSEPSIPPRPDLNFCPHCGEGLKAFNAALDFMHQQNHK